MILVGHRYRRPGIAAVAGLTPEQALGTRWAFTFPDEDTPKRALVAPMGIAPRGLGPRSAPPLGGRRDGVAFMPLSRTCGSAPWHSAPDALAGVVVGG